MKEPKAVYCKHKKNIVHHYELPDREWLEYQYVALDKSTVEISKEFGMSRNALCNWCYKFGISVRTPKEVGERNSRRFSGEGNPAWKGGTARNYQKGFLLEHRPEAVCEWCGDIKNIELHHRNHDVTDGNLDNLAWLCHSCNNLEAGMWALQQCGHTVEVLIDSKKVSQ